MMDDRRPLVAVTLQDGDRALTREEASFLMHQAGFDLHYGIEALPGTFAVSPVKPLDLPHDGSDRKRQIKKAVERQLDSVPSNHLIWRQVQENQSRRRSAPQRATNATALALDSSQDFDDPLYPQQWYLVLYIYSDRSCSIIERCFSKARE